MFVVSVDIALMMSCYAGSEHPWRCGRRHRRCHRPTRRASALASPGLTGAPTSSAKLAITFTMPSTKPLALRDGTELTTSRLCFTVQSWHWGSPGHWKRRRP